MQLPNRVAVSQMTSTGDHDANLAVCRRLAEQARGFSCTMARASQCMIKQEANLKG